MNLWEGLISLLAIVCAALLPIAYVYGVKEGIEWGREMRRKPTTKKGE